MSQGSDRPPPLPEIISTLCKRHGITATLEAIADYCQLQAKITEVHGEELKTNSEHWQDLSEALRVLLEGWEE